MKEFCPICGAAGKPATMPFCSKRCANIDLGRWLKGSYVIQGEDGDAMLPANDRQPEPDTD